MVLNENARLARATKSQFHQKFFFAVADGESIDRSHPDPGEAAASDGYFGIQSSKNVFFNSVVYHGDRRLRERSEPQGASRGLVRSQKRSQEPTASALRFTYALV